MQYSYPINMFQPPPPAEWKLLECMTADLASAELKNGSVQRHGRDGQSQFGVDIHGRLLSGGLLGIQCKKKDILARQNFTIKDLREEVEKAKQHDPPLEELRIYHTAPDDGAVQREALRITNQHQKRGLFRVMVYGWLRILEQLANYPQITRKYYGFFSSPRMTTALRQKHGLVPDPTQKGYRLAALTPSMQHAFGMLAAIQFPFTRQSLEQLLPQIDWKNNLRSLSRLRQVMTNEAGVAVPQELARAFFRNKTDQVPYDKEWLVALEPLRFHVDTGIVLVGVYGRLRRYDDLFAQLKMLTESVEPSDWMDILLAVLSAMSSKKALRRLQPPYRMVIQYCMALCLTRMARNAEAQNWISQLRHQATILKDSWYRAEADLLEGNVFDSEGDYDKAIRYFQLAADRAKTHRHYLLRGHALSNMVAPLALVDLEAAQRALDESIKAKKKAGEKDGGIGALIGQGHLLINLKQYKQAQKMFSRAAALAKKLNDEPALAIAEYNVACSLFDQQQEKLAISHYKTAVRLAAEHRNDALQRQAIHGLGSSYAYLKMYLLAEKEFKLQYELDIKASDLENAVIAQHNIGAMQLYLKRYSEGRKTLEQSESLANRIRDIEWTYLSVRHQAYSHRDEGSVRKGVQLLERRIAHYRRARQYEVAAKLAEELTFLLLSMGKADEQIQASYRLQADCWRLLKGKHLEQWNALSILSAWQWEHGYFDTSMKTLGTLADLARKHGMREHLGRVWDQLGVNHQHLMRYTEAESCHKKGLKLAQKLKNKELLKNGYNNLGELYRKTEQLQKAQALFKQCEHQARLTGDIETQIATAHNRALVLRDLGKAADATKILVNCRKVALKHRIWPEYVRALLGMANDASEHDKLTLAEKLYRQTIQSASKHEVQEQLWQAKLNLANLYRHQGKAAKAIKLLEQCVPDFWLVTDGCEHFGYLAECYSEIGRHENARTYWKYSLEMAIKVADIPGQLHAKLALATVTGRMDGFKAGDAAFRRLLNVATTDEKVMVCRCAVEAAIDCNELEFGNKWIGRLNKLAVREQDAADVVDTYMLFGDALWQDHRNEAVEHFLVGLVKSAEINIDAFIQTGMHLFWKLHAIDQAERDILQTHAEKWLVRQFNGQEVQSALSVLLWPFSVVREFVFDVRHTPDEAANAITRLITRYFVKTTGS